jgi:predicted kinase
MLVVVCGPPGTGKTTVAEWIADHLGAVLLRTDLIRRDVVEDPRYTETERERVYVHLYRRIENREGDASDATVENYREIHDGFDPVTRADLRIDNSGSLGATERALQAHFDGS